MLSGAKVILFGPQARGDAREDSDWDILILLNKDKVELDDHDYISYPFLNLDDATEEEILPLIDKTVMFISKMEDLLTFK